ncbi:alpha-N-acetylglucosaminidase [Wenjunlia vitaminophila]|uniref:Alpha-N-acetylglucosaminidase n=1 Tax=Wenjunlia vitaminophila TaxID=76728 RepID=A0A0T6LWH9_WENVI|nr:alpha-N-acetylglucosaminidase [Wenjunlia vitaminophila]KRV50475.1 alpha-N-acetylglucosaminidase [Wenjunlia vitaminophila]
MTELSRRTVLGTAAILGAGTALGGYAPAGATDQPFATASANEALVRLLGPTHAAQFQLVPVPRSDSQEEFVVSGPAGRIEVRGTSPTTLLTGVHWYLKYVCRAQVSWTNDQLDLPDTLPAVGQTLRQRTTVPHRFALNDTNDGYTRPYGDWSHWERLIDVLALHGCNEVLVIAGMEAVYHRALMEFGYSDAEARAWIPAPTHQPWWLLQNLSGYGGPISEELLATRIELGQRIAERLRALEMEPVFPGYFGQVPEGFVDRNPGARVVPQGTWQGFRRPDWQDPRTAVFGEFAASFYRHQRDLFGSARYFKMDLLHEGGTPGDVPVGDAARGVERALRAAHPQSTWVILGWQNNPRRQLLDAIDKQQMLIVDGLSDRYDAEADRDVDWGGTPYAFGTIPNYGGRTTLGARTHRWLDRYFAWRDKPGSALVGTAYLPEAVDRDPAAFEFFSELAWRDEPMDAEQWFAEYADLRYGDRDGHARKAWSALHLSAYQHSARQRSDPHDSLFQARPSLTANSAAVFAPQTLTYDPSVLDTALDELLRVRPELRERDSYRQDLVDVARQALANRSRQLLPVLRTAYARKDLETFRDITELWLRLMRLSDELAGTHRHFLLGPWLADAQRMASSASESAELERTARVLVTTWGHRAAADAGDLAEYANREWHGLISDFYLPRWQRYFTELEDALVEGRAPRSIDWYAMEEPWTRDRTPYPQRPVALPHPAAQRVRDVLARAPHQGNVTISAEPTTLSPDRLTLLTATFTNVNGLAPTGRVDLELTGPDARPEGPTWLPQVPAGGQGTVRWQATAPQGPLDRPLRPLPYELTATYGPQGQPRVRTVRSGSLYVAGPLDAALTTVTNNDAVFGQLGERYAIDGAGNDLWTAQAHFGAIVRAGAMGDGTSVTTRVDSQAVTGPWARAGIIVRDSLATAGSRGFVNLSVTPANGVVLSFDANGDGTLDTYRRVTGVKAPVTLRLTRSGAAYTGEFSTDDGVTWRTVATVTAPGGTAGGQDVGLFMSAANGGSGARGLVEFTGFTVNS